jgi:uncharacterized protein YdeI (YjbR/CyaY-like superfamily)
MANKNPLVDELLRKKKSPMTAEIQRVREIILETSDKIEETVKWSAPTFMYKGNIASFYMNTKQHVSLMFHTGAAIPDKYEILEGDGNVSRVVKFADMKDIEKKKKALQAVIKEWIKLKDKTGG